MLRIRGNAKYGPPVIRISILPTIPQLLYDPSKLAASGLKGVDCRALLDTGADGTSVTQQLAEAAQLSYRGKTLATGIAGENFHRSWTTFVGLYAEDDIGALPYVLPEPLLAIEVMPYPAFDVILGRDVLMLGDFTLKSNGDFEFCVPTSF
jgi:hypothetical protein